MNTFLTCLTATLLVFAPLAAQEVIWFEAEAYSESNWPHGRSGSGPFKPKDEAEAARLSEGVWLNDFRAKQQHFLTYEVAVPVAGTYAFWARAFATHRGTRAPFRWRFDDSEWIDQPTHSGEAMDMVKPTSNTTLKWIKLANVELAAGNHRLRIEITDPDSAMGFDCFVLAPGVFVPNGALEPGEASGLADPGTWAFEPGPDPYTDAALVDLSHLNEDRAGENGFIRRDGADLVLGDGTPVRLWSVEYHPAPTMAMAREQARFLAKRGVNAVRFFKTFPDTSKGAADGAIDEHLREDLWRTVAAMREEGIYVMITPLWIFQHFEVQSDWGWPGWEGKDSWRRPNGAIFVDPAFQEAYRTWMRQIFAEPNPHTGVPIAQDPSVWCIQIQNEHSPLWSWFHGSPPSVLRRLAAGFGSWAADKHGSLAAAIDAWGGPVDAGDGLVGDDPAAGLAAIPREFGPLRANRSAEEAAADPDLRTADFLAYLAQVMRDFNTDMADFYRDELGYDGLISANNWKGQGPNLSDVERSTYTVNDVIDHHHYFGYPHVNPQHKRKAGYSVNQGDRYVDQSALLEPMGICTSNKMVAGFPNVISEGSWVAPLSYRSEAPLMIASYGSLIGLDMFNFFAWNSITWDRQVQKFGIATPTYLGQFPAAALMYRRGDIAQAAQAAVHERRSPAELWSRQRPLIGQPKVRDPTRVAEELSQEGEDAVSPLAYLVGPVEVAFADDAEPTSVVDLGEFVDPQAGTVHSLTGEMLLDYGRGLLRLDTPRAQAVSGSLARAGEQRLSTLGLSTDNDYATVMAVSLDDQPLATSRQVLIQIGTRSRPHGWQDRVDGTLDGHEAKVIENMGGMPWNVELADMRIHLANPSLTTATACDGNGYPLRELELARDADGVSFTAPEDALYVVLQ